MNSNLPRTLALAFLAFLMVTPAQAQLPDVLTMVATSTTMADEVILETQMEVIDGSIAAGDVVAEATGDEDRDGLPDALESEICRRAVIANAINTVNGNPAGVPTATCSSEAPWEFTPYPHKQQVRQYTSLGSNGPDLDNDGFPRYIRINYRTLEIDPFSPERVRHVSSSYLTQNVDTNDNDPNWPALSVLDLPVILTTSVSFGGDADRDGVPSFAQFERVGVHFDRREAAEDVVTFPAASSTQETLDADDADPNVPAASIIEASAPVMIVQEPDVYDNDDDYVPGSYRVFWTDMVFDRRDGTNGLTLSEHETTHGVGAEDDADSGAPAPAVDTIDGDRDGVVDQVEPSICDMEDRGRPEDGSCDVARSDYTPLLGLHVNPWNDL